jgi:formate hydrogenlyase subunit 6/NADH:ubiquinone oxidoreductase subunit I
MDWLERIFRPLRTGIVTSNYPGSPPLLAPAVRGLPVVDPERCTLEAACVVACPTDAIAIAGGTGGTGGRGDDGPGDRGADAGGTGALPAWTLDAGRCVFCGACEPACPTDAIALGDRVELAVRDRAELVVTTLVRGPRP